MHFLTKRHLVPHRGVERNKHNRPDPSIDGSEGFEEIEGNEGDVCRCRGHLFVRYADDSLIFCKSKRGAERVCEGLTKFIEKKLHLKVNLDKTEVGYVRGMKYLGHTFYKTGEG